MDTHTTGAASSRTDASSAGKGPTQGFQIGRAHV